MTTETIERFSQPTEVEAVIERTRYSIAYQEKIAAEWVWPEISTVAWHALLEGVTDRETGFRNSLLVSDTARDRVEAEAAAAPGA